MIKLDHDDFVCAISYAQKSKFARIPEVARMLLKLERILRKGELYFEPFLKRDK
jgi:hypothetical protein